MIGPVYFGTKGGIYALCILVHRKVQTKQTTSTKCNKNTLGESAESSNASSKLWQSCMGYANNKGVQEMIRKKYYDMGVENNPMVKKLLNLCLTKKCRASSSRYLIT